MNEQVTNHCCNIHQGSTECGLMDHLYQNHPQNLLNTLECLGPRTETLNQNLQKNLGVLFVSTRGNSWPANFGKHNTNTSSSFGRAETWTHLYSSVSRCWPDYFKSAIKYKSSKIFCSVPRHNYYLRTSRASYSNIYV